MIDTEQTVTVDAPIASVWDYVADMRRWATLMPGFREYEVIDADDSRWVLKVGVGGLVRTVRVFVHVDDWAGPGRVDFTFRLEGDPVEGGGTYRAKALPDGGTAMTLAVRVSGSGVMAPMWEAMGGPLLPKFARAFAEQLKGGIEEAAHGAAPEEKATACVGTQPGWIGSVRQKLFGAKSDETAKEDGL